MSNEEKDARINEIAAGLGVRIPALPTDEFAPINWEQAREMDASGLSIESHTVTHPILTNISQTELDYELQTSKKRLETALGREVENFCYPNGSFDAQVRRSVENAGYKCAVTTNYGFNEKQTNQFALNRIDALAAIENFAQSVSGFEAMKQRI
jgi:peptidoglycan/xylan/chitin deacetylase (PgdA/CDA1 family)